MLSSSTYPILCLVPLHNAFAPSCLHYAGVFTPLFIWSFSLSLYIPQFPYIFPYFCLSIFSTSVWLYLPVCGCLAARRHHYASQRTLKYKRAWLARSNLPRPSGQFCLSLLFKGSFWATNIFRIETGQSCSGITAWVSSPWNFRRILFDEQHNAVSDAIDILKDLV